MLDVRGLTTTFETEDGPLRAIDDVSFATDPALLAKVEAAWSAQAPQPIADHDDDEGVSRLGR